VIGEVGVNPEDTVEFTAPVQENANSAVWYVQSWWQAEAFKTPVEGWECY
jgi:hypothetical protein